MMYSKLFFFIKENIFLQTNKNNMFFLYLFLIILRLQVIESQKLILFERSLVIHGFASWVFSRVIRILNERIRHWVRENHSEMVL